MLFVFIYLSSKLAGYATRLFIVVYATSLLLKIEKLTGTQFICLLIHLCI